MTDPGAASLSHHESLLVAAFEGWNDAGSAASHALEHLAHIWNAQEYAALDPEDYHDFQVSRPAISRGSDGEQILTWPGTVVSTAVGPFARERRIALARGIEPSMRWRQFCDELLDLAEDLEVTTLITCGALLVDVPHTRPLPTFVTSEDADVRQALSLERTDYEGPVGIVSVLGHAARQRGIKVLSMWVGVPHYVAHPPSPKASLALLAQMERLLGEPFDLGDLPDDAVAWQRGADELTREDDDLADHVRQLETMMDETSLPEASGDAIAAEFERYLRRRDGGTAK